MGEVRRDELCSAFLAVKFYVMLGMGWVRCGCYLNPKWRRDGALHDAGGQKVCWGLGRQGSLCVTSTGLCGDVLDCARIVEGQNHQRNEYV
jgi:hypothetical protein